jgi:hypothetical protein
MAHLGRSCRGRRPLNHGGRYARKMLDPLSMGGRDGNMPQDRPQPRPPVAGRRPPRLAIEANKPPTGGLIALMALLALILFGVAPLFTIQSVPHRGPYLAYLSYFAYFYRRRSKRECLGDDYLICFRPLLGPTPHGRTGSYRRGEYSAGRSYTAVRSVDGLDAPCPAIVAVERVSRMVLPKL